MATSKVSLKLLIDKKGNKVLFAEAGKDFVDFLFNLLGLPIATVIRLLKKNNMVGCLGKLYESIENLSETYMQPNQNKDSLLKPKAPISLTASQLPLLLSEDDDLLLSEDDDEDNDILARPKLYICENCYEYVSNDARAVCPGCDDENLSSEVSFVVPQPAINETAAAMVVGGEEGGYVKGVVTYMVMDDLLVTPMSTISGLTMLNKFNIKEVGALEEKVVEISMTEGLKLLKASLQSNSVLTSVFL